MNTKIGTLFATIVALALLVSCSGGSSIVGMWQEFGGDETLDFFKDGTISAASASKEMALGGKYSFVEVDRMKVELGGVGALAGPMIMTVAISGGELSLTNPTGKVSRYKKM
jgi:hypothetical protein